MEELKIPSALMGTMIGLGIVFGAMAVVEIKKLYDQIEILKQEVFRHPREE